MSEFNTIGGRITMPQLRDYIMTHQLNAGDSLVLNPHDFSEIVKEIKASDEKITDVPLSLLGVLILQDRGLSVPAGKVQIVKNDQL